MTATETLHLGAERAPFVMVPRWLLHAGHVSDGAKVLYGVLHDLVSGREGPTRPVTRGQLAECCGVSIATVDRRLAELVNAGAVDKQAQFETHQGQLANVYWVRLSPPIRTSQPSVENPVEDALTPRCSSAAPPAATLQPPPLQPCGEPGRMGAAPSQEEQEEELSPPTPRPAGGDLGSSGGGGKRSEGTNPRALGANPRAERATAEAKEARLLAERNAAAIDAEIAARRTEAARAAAEQERAEAEAMALSAALPDDLLHALLARVRETLPGPLGSSPVGLARAAITWSRAAAANGEVAAALRSALDAGWSGPEACAMAPRLDLPPPPSSTRPLLDRVRSWLEAQRTDSREVSS